MPERFPSRAIGPILRFGRVPSDHDWEQEQRLQKVPVPGDYFFLNWCVYVLNSIYSISIGLRVHRSTLHAKKKVAGRNNHITFFRTWL
jgi:asparagine synthetase A